MHCMLSNNVHVLYRGGNGEVNVVQFPDFEEFLYP